MKRSDVLAKANDTVSIDRNQQYGEPEDVFALIADLWTSYLGEWANISPHDVAAMMALLKIARIKGNAQHMDSWIDLAGYAACGGEVASRKDGA